MTRPNERLLILHDDPDSYLPLLAERFPELQTAVCRQSDEVMPTVRALDPTIIYSWKSNAIAHAVQQEALRYPSVKWVQIGGAGFDHLLPLPGATAVFTNTSGVLAPYMAETVMGALLMLNFDFPRAIRQQREHLWQPYTYPTVAGKTAVIVGLGHIGKVVAQRAKQFGMRVIGIRQQQTAVPRVDLQLTPDQLHEALPQADFLCLHVPLTPKTRHMMDGVAFGSMKKTAVLINTSRGGVVDEDALLNALQSGQIKAAYSDVFETEPLPKESPLWEAPNLIISPHIADTVEQWEVAYTEFFCQNLGRWLAGDAVKNVVNIERGY